MQNALCVRGGKSRAELARDLDGFVLRQPPDAAEQRSQILAIDILHREERLAVHFADIVNAAHIGVRDLARDRTSL